MNCPLCNELLEKNDNYPEIDIVWTCSSEYIGVKAYNVHYGSHFVKKESGYIAMVIFPYRIVTMLNYAEVQDQSVIQKYHNDCIFLNILNTRELNIDPILPMPEKELRKRLETILVFS